MEETRAPAPADTATAPQETTPQETTPQEPVDRDVTEINLPPHKEKINQMLSEYESRQAARKEQRAREEAKPPEPETCAKGRAGTTSTRARAPSSSERWPAFGPRQPASSRSWRGSAEPSRRLEMPS